MPFNCPPTSKSASLQASWLVALALVAVAPLHAAQGDLDTSFGTDGKLFQPGVFQWNDVAQQADGRIVAAGFRFNGSDMEFLLARYELDGSPDASFGTDGLVGTDLGAGDDHGRDVALQADDRIVVVGYGSNGSNDDIALARYDTDGSLDTNFDGDGKLTTAIGSGTDRGNSDALQPDGRIVVGGHSFVSTVRFALLRYNADGSLDTDLGGSGMVTTVVGGSGNDFANAVALQPDGKIVLAGDASMNSAQNFALVRYHANGSLDTGFGDAGHVSTDVAGINGVDILYALALQADGKLLAAGSAQGIGAAMVRYLLVSPPSAPVMGGATPGDSAATVAFSEPDDDGGAPILGYTVSAVEDPARTCTVTLPADPLACTVTGLTNGQSYRFVVAASNDQGQGPASAESNAVTPMGEQVITDFMADPANPVYAAGGNFTVSATGGASGNPVNFSIDAASSTVCSAGGSPNTWIDAENAVINGLLSEITYREIFNDIDVVVAEMPGLIPAFEYLFEGYKVDENNELETMAYLFNAVRNYRQEKVTGSE